MTTPRDVVPQASSVDQPGLDSVSVSAVIYSRNEADLLRTSLAAAVGFDEVIVCDMQSTDDTVALARHASARVEAVPDARVIEEVRQHGLDVATSDWVLFVDADEILPPGFSGHLRRIIAAGTDAGIVAFRLRYSNVAFGRTLQHTLVGSAKYSLMRTDSARFPSPGIAHVPPVFSGPVSDAPSEVPPILHLSFRTAGQLTEKALRYADASRGDLDLLRPTRLVREVLRHTVFGGTWRDGYAGSVVSTSIVFGRWYEALLTAERKGLLDTQLPPREQRRLLAASRAHAVVTRTRDRIVHVLHAARRTAGSRGRGAS